MHSGMKWLSSPTFYEKFWCGFDQESRVSHAVSDTKGTRCILVRRGLALLLYTGEGIVTFASRIESSPRNSDIEGTWRIMARGGLALLLSTRDCIVASVENRQFPSRFWYQRNFTHSGPKRLVYPTFYDWLYCGFSWESRVPKANSDVVRTWRILAWSGLALPLSMCDWNVASAKSREFPCSFWYLKNTMHSRPKRLGSPTFSGRLLCCFDQEPRVPQAFSNTEGIRHNLARSVLALLLTMGNYGFRRQSRVFHAGSVDDATLTPSSSKQLGTPTFLGQLYCGFNRESRILHTGFNREGTWRIPASFGYPKSIVSDRDKVFLSHFWRELFRLAGTKLNHSTAYHPQTDGQTEVVNRGVETFLGCFCGEKPKEWVKWILWAEYWYNTTYQRAIGVTLFQAVYGHLPPPLEYYGERDTTNSTLDE